MKSLSIEQFDGGLGLAFRVRYYTKNGKEKARIFADHKMIDLLFFVSKYFGWEEPHKHISFDQWFEEEMNSN